MNLIFDVERINDVSFNGKKGVIDLDIPKYAIMDVLSNIDDDDLIEEIESRGYKVVEE